MRSTTTSVPAMAGSHAASARRQPCTIASTPTKTMSTSIAGTDHGQGQTAAPASATGSGSATADTMKSAIDHRGKRTARRGAAHSIAPNRNASGAGCRYRVM